MKNMPNKKGSVLIIDLILNASVAVMSVAGCFMMKQGPAMLCYYTIDSNILGALACAIYAVYDIYLLTKKTDSVPRWVSVLKLAATGCLTLTFIVVITILAPTYGDGGYYFMLLEGPMLFHHFLSPVVAFLSLVLFEHKISGSVIKTSLIAFIPTVIYTIVITVLNLLKVMEGPYPFLYVYKQPIWMSVVWFIVIPGFAYLFLLAILLLNKRFSLQKQV